jgi:hypothetical protein
MLHLALAPARSVRFSCSARLLFGLALVAPLACSPTSARQTRLATDAPISVKASQLFVTVRNGAGLPVVDVDVTIVPIGKSTEFKKFISRMEAAEERDYSLSEFRGSDGTPFSLRIVRPKGIRISAKDVVGKVYNVEVPWQ